MALSSSAADCRGSHRKYRRRASAPTRLFRRPPRTRWASSIATRFLKPSRLRRADPAHRDARTQFYIAYSYYRQGWGRVYNDDPLFRKGLEAVDRAIALAPDHRVVVSDAELGMHRADELKADSNAASPEKPRLQPLESLPGSKMTAAREAIVLRFRS